MTTLVAHPLLSAAAVTVAGFSLAAFILRFELRYQMRQHRRGGYLIGGGR